MASHFVRQPVPNRRALIVDDDPVSRKLLRAMLDQQGWAVSDFPATGIALDSITSHGAELILFEIGMQSMTGLELCRVIRSQGGASQPKIVAYTAHAQQEDKKLFMSNGFDDILLKPVNSKTVAAMLERLGQ